MGQRWKEGDLVFVRITGYPWWPGQARQPASMHLTAHQESSPRSSIQSFALQVMAEDRVSSKFMALKKTGTFPINFFGDNEFGWSPSDDMISLPDQYETLSKPKGPKHKVSNSLAGSSTYPLLQGHHAPESLCSTK